jgi:hypothetical protein
MIFPGRDDDWEDPDDTEFEEDTRGKNTRDLTEIERKTYEFIKEAGEIQTTNMPDSRMVGAISNLKNRGLVEIYKKYTSIYRRRKKKFVKAKT